MKKTDRLDRAKARWKEARRARRQWRRRRLEIDRLRASLRIAPERDATLAGDVRITAEMLDDSMSPRFEAGVKLVFNMDRRPCIGDDVMVIPKKGGPFVRKLVGIDGPKIHLMQWNPKSEFTYPLEKVAKIYRCIGWFEPEI